MRRLFVAAAVLGLAACSPIIPLPSPPHKGAPAAACADVVAAALVSPDRAVAGAFACLSAERAAALARATGKSGDAALLEVAKMPPIYTSISSHGITGDGGHFYALEGTDKDGKPSSEILLLYQDDKGKVAVVAFASR